MPTFDGSSSKLSRSEADLLRGVLGPARLRATSLRAAARGYRRTRRRTILRRAAIVAVLLGGFLGSTHFVGQKRLAFAAVASRTVSAPVVTGSITPVRTGDRSIRRSLELAP